MIVSHDQRQSNRLMIPDSSKDVLLRSVLIIDQSGNWREAFHFRMINDTIS